MEKFYDTAGFCYAIRLWRFVIHIDNQHKALRYGGIVTSIGLARFLLWRISFVNIKHEFVKNAVMSQGLGAFGLVQVGSNIFMWGDTGYNNPPKIEIVLFRPYSKEWFYCSVFGKKLTLDKL